MRTTSGSWRVAKDFANLPAWIVKSVGGSTVHWAGASLRFDEHEFKARTTYGQLPGANLLDWPVTLAEMEPWYAKAEDKRFPIRKVDLEVLHRFDEEVRYILGLTSLYNEALGSTNARTVYDRLTGRADR